MFGKCKIFFSGAVRTLKCICPITLTTVIQEIWANPDPVLAHGQTAITRTSRSVVPHGRHGLTQGPTTHEEQGQLSPNSQPCGVTHKKRHLIAELPRNKTV